MNAKEIANEGIVTQLAVVHTMLPKVKELIDQQADRIAELEELNETFVDLIKSYRVEIETLRQKILNKENEK